MRVTPVTIRLPEGAADQIDARVGPYRRSQFIRSLVMEELSTEPMPLSGDDREKAIMAIAQASLAVCETSNPGVKIPFEEWRRCAEASINTLEALGFSVRRITKTK